MDSSAMGDPGYRDCEGTACTHLSIAPPKLAASLSFDGSRASAQLAAELELMVKMMSPGCTLPVLLPLTGNNVRLGHIIEQLCLQNYIHNYC